MDAQELVERFEIFDDWEERYAYLIELGRKLPPYPEDARDEAHRVRGCVSKVWLTHEQRGEVLHFDADSDAFIVKGLVAILLMLYSDKTPQEIRSVPVEQVFEDIGLSGHLTPSRRNGFFSMVEKIRQIGEGAS